MRLSDFKALSFDVYGTLIDWEQGIATALRPLVAASGLDLSTNDVLSSHAAYESRLQTQSPRTKYCEVLTRVYRLLAADWRVEPPEGEPQEYGKSIRNWPPFSDSAESIGYLSKHFKLFVLSNVDNESFAHSRAKLGVEFDGVYTAEDVGSYKPDVRNFQFLIDQLSEFKIGSGEVLHTAESLFHDHEPANALGLSSCHIHRRHGKDGFGATVPPRGRPHVDFRFNSLRELALAHMRETGQV